MGLVRKWEAADKSHGMIHVLEFDPASSRPLAPQQGRL